MDKLGKIFTYNLDMLWLFLRFVYRFAIILATKITGIVLALSQNEQAKNT
jgi:hypothetical protein